jgi:hypothetical protein
MIAAPALIDKALLPAWSCGTHSTSTFLKAGLCGIPKNV